MGFQGGDILRTGTFEGMTYYHNKLHGWLIRKKGGPKSEDVRTQDNFVRSRENSQEFVTCSKMASELRRQVMLSGIRDTTLYPRMFKLAKALQLLDKTSTRGNSNPKLNIASKEGIVLLKKFIINKDLNLFQLLIQRKYLDPALARPAKPVKKTLVKKRPFKKLKLVSSKRAMTRRGKKVTTLRKKPKRSSVKAV